MSKPSSYLATGTTGEKKFTSIIQKYLREKITQKIKKLINSTKGGSRKAAVVGAYDIRTGNIATSFADEIPINIHPELLKRANEIGGIGTHGLTERNIIGVCAEFHVVNQLLLKGSKWHNIRIINPIRPRTGQIIPFCANCQKMFYDIIDKGE